MPDYSIYGSDNPTITQLPTYYYRERYMSKHFPISRYQVYIQILLKEYDFDKYANVFILCHVLHPTEYLYNTVQK